ncbi:MAG: TonB-dependent receptor [Methylibium sp.]|nr:TonB-dependent receptor [Methylibium sp.]
MSIAQGVLRVAAARGWRGLQRLATPRLLGTWAGLPAGVLALAAAVAAPPAGGAALADLSLEQLSEIVVTSVSLRSEPLQDVAASVYVIRAEDIRRSGATTLTEALRLAPTLDVARVDATGYAISARGFNNPLANKMLVMIDGRSIYTPLFAGVFWDAQEVLLSEVDRIEVITGPSTAQWGTNAVNGLIHVITRSAAETQGAALRAHAGNRERGGSARWGGAFPGNDDERSGYYRVYAKAFDRSNSTSVDGSPVNDQADGQQAGFRSDWSRQGDEITLQGDLYRNLIDANVNPIKVEGANVLGRWQRTMAGGAFASVQAYAERTERRQVLRFSEKLDTFDAVAQYGFAPTAGHRLLLGAGLRHSRDETTGNPLFAFRPNDRTLNWSRLFIQDQIELPHRLALTLGGSLEHNPYTGLETLPSVRLAWRASDSSLFWGSAQRAVRAPSRIDREFFSPAEPNADGTFNIAGGPDFQSEVSNVLELGHRGQLTETFSYSLTFFYHDHDDLRSVTPTPRGQVLENNIEGSTRGLEATASWRVSPRWRLTAGGVSLDQRLRVKEGEVDTIGLNSLGNDPNGWWQLRSALDLTPRHSWDLSVRRVASRPQFDVSSYTAVDTRLAWRVSAKVELALLVKDLLDAEQVEWATASRRVEHGRAASLQLRAQF